MNLINKLNRLFKQPVKQDYDLLLQEQKKLLCKYSENPFSTDFRNYMQPIKKSNSPTGWGMRKLSIDQVKSNLDKGICFIDYPNLNEDGTEIK